MRKPRRPTTRESIRALLTQSPLPIPANVVRSISEMASADVLRELALGADPIDRQTLNRAADLADQDPTLRVRSCNLRSLPAVRLQQTHPHEGPTPHDADAGGWEAFLEANPVGAR
jgi:hypothetical protein